MEIVEWSDPVREIERAEACSFFDAPLPETTLFRFTTTRFRIVPHAGAFSLKLVRSGEERYEFAKRSVRLPVGHSLLINAAQTYSSSIDQRTQSTSVFFCNNDVAAMYRLMSESNDHLLDNAEEIGDTPYVPQTAVPFSQLTRQRVSALMAALDEDDMDTVECLTWQFLYAALETTLNLAPPEFFANIRRRVTRDEILTRLLRARQYIDDNNGLDCKLDDLAETACLSKYHFLRMFNQVFGQTPMAYARRRRLDAARRDLADGASVECVAQKAGYHNRRSFERAYRRVFGTRTDR